MWSVTLALYSLRYLMHTAYTHLKKGKKNSDIPFLLKVREMLQIRRDDDLSELQYLHCGLVLDPTAGFLVTVSVSGASGAAVWNKTPGKAHALLHSIDLPPSFAFLNH